MGQALALALAGLRARRASSAAVLVVLVVALAAAVIGPVFLRAAEESALRRELRTGPVLTRVLAVESTDTATDPAAVGRAVTADLAADPVLRTVVGPAIRGGEVDTRTGQAATLPVVWREAVCAHLVLRSGRCPTAAGEVVLADPLPSDEGWRLLGPVDVVPGVPLTLVGTYQPIDVQDPYWAGHAYDPNNLTGDPRNPVRRLAAAFTVSGTVVDSTAPGRPRRDVLDVPVLAARVTVRNADRVQAALQQLSDGLPVQAPDGVLTTQLPDALRRAAADRDRLRPTVLLVVGQLLLLALLVLGLVVEGTSSARAPEVALARLRGLGRWRVAAFGLLDVVLLVVAALPLSLVAGLLAVRLATAGRLSRGTPVVLTDAAVLGAVAAVVVAVLVAALAGRQALRTPATELLRTTAPRRRRGGGSVVIAVLVLAAAGAAELGLGGGLRPDRLDAVALATPGALALAVALLGARLLPVACRLLVLATRSRGPVAAFLAVRQLARRPAGGRSVVAVGTAFGLAAFAVFAVSVQDQNRHDRALADTGADTVYAVQAGPGVDLQRVVRTADPGGHAMAAVLYDSPDSGPGQRRLLAVDASRLAAVSFWRADLGDTSPHRVAGMLTPAVGLPILLQGDVVDVRVDASNVTRRAPDEPVVADPPSLRLELDSAGGGRQQLDLGPVSPGDHQLPVVGCSLEPCRLRALRVTRTLQAAPLTVDLTLERLAVRRAGVWTEVAATAQAARWRTDQSSAPAPVAGPVGLHVQLAAAAGQNPALTAADSPGALPVVVTPTRFAPLGQLEVPGLDALDHPARQVARAVLIPGAGADAALADLTLADRAASGGRSDEASASVWAAPGAPADLVARLRAGGVRVTATGTAAGRAAVLAAQGPALAVRLLLLAGATGTLLAAGGATLSLALLGRRRRYELAALQAAGVRPRSLTVSVLAEQVALLVAGAALGLVAGSTGAALAIGSVPQFDDVDPGLPLLSSPRPGAAALGLGAAVVVVLVAGLLSGIGLVRGRGVERLREAQT